MKRGTCRDCAALVADEAGNWICEDLDMAIEEIENGECPEGMVDTVRFEIFITDLNDDAKKRVEQIIGNEHNFDVLPLAIIELIEGESEYEL